MCFAIPIKVIHVDRNTATLENGTVVRLEKGMQLKKEQYVRLSGNIIVDHLSKKDGDAIRKLIMELQIHYE